MSKVLHLENNVDFDGVKNEGIVLVDFFATWCRPCQMLGPVLDELSEEVDYKIVKVDVDQFPDIAATYSVRSIPTLLLFNNGELKMTEMGYKSKAELIALVNTNK